MTTVRYLGLDLGGTNIKSVVIEAGEPPRVVGSASAPTAADSGPAGVIARMVTLGRNTIATHGPVVGAGVGVPGLFDKDTGVVELFPNLPGAWPGHSMRAPLAAGLGVPVTLVNDARACTLAEGTVGAGQGCRTLVCVALGTGVGGGIMIDGRLHLGAAGTAGEIGHQTVMPDGPPCGCGNRGCLESFTRADVLARLGGKPTAEDVYAAARAGEPRAVGAVATVAHWLGIGLANVVTVLGPDRIVIGGGIAAAGELLLAPVREAVRARVTLVPTEHIQIVPAALGTAAGAIGAALAASAAAAV